MLAQEKKEAPKKAGRRGRHSASRDGGGKRHLGQAHGHDRDQARLSRGPPLRSPPAWTASRSPEPPITRVGEIVDFSCYIQLGKHGEKHRACGQKCVKTASRSAC